MGAPADLLQRESPRTPKTGGPVGPRAHLESKSGRIARSVWCRRPVAQPLAAPLQSCWRFSSSSSLTHCSENVTFGQLIAW
jgi:hypothetical protein